MSHYSFNYTLGGGQAPSPGPLARLKAALLLGVLVVIGAVILVGVRALTLEYLYSNPVTKPYAPWIPSGFVVTMATWGYAIANKLRDPLYFGCITFGVILAHFAQPFFFVAQPEFWVSLYGEPYVELIMKTQGRWMGLVD